MTRFGSITAQGKQKENRDCKAEIGYITTRNTRMPSLQSTWGQLVPWHTPYMITLYSLFSFLKTELRPSMVHGRGHG